MKKNLEIKAYEDILGTVKHFVLIQPYVKLWQELEDSLNLEEGEIPSEVDFKNFVDKNKISIPNIEDSEYGLIVLPW